SAPRRGDRVQVEAGHVGALARLLTGKIDTTQNQVPGGLVSELVADFDMPATTVTVPALLPRMPPVHDGEAFRYIGLTATWPTQYALRQAGFYATPAGRTGGAVSASLNGSLWPEAGALRASDSMPLFAAAPWGQAPYGFSATYHGGSASMMDQPLEVSLLVSPEAATANSFITVNFDGGLIRVAADATGSVRVQMST